jgi:pre-rRNA-processing protein IPI3
MVHVWALPLLLSFSPDTLRSPLHTLSTHRGPVMSVVCGHSSSSSNIAVSVSQDKSAIIWNYHSGQALRTYLLPELPEAVTLDPADRALYIAYGDGSLQIIDFYDDWQKAAPTDMVQDKSLSHRPMQPSKRSRFSAESQKLGAALSLSLSWDGTTIISGHESGKVALWDAAKRNWQSILANLPGPVTNLRFLEPTGFPNAQEPPFKIYTVVKPKQDLGLVNSTSLVPPNYSLTMQFTGRLPSQPISATDSRVAKQTEFEEALTHPSFPQYMLEESLAELESWNAPSRSGVAPAADFLSLNEDSIAEATPGAHSQELSELKKQLASLQRVQKVTFEQLSELREENTHFHDIERKRSQHAQRKAKGKLANGSPDTDGDMEMSEASSSDGEESDSESDSESAHTDSDASGQD